MADLPNRSTPGVTVHETWCWRRHRHFTTSLELATTLTTTYRKAAEVIEKFAPDVLHAHFVFPSGIIAYLLSRRFGIPYVLTAHGSDIPGYNPDRFNLLHHLMRPLWRTVMRHATVTTSPSEFLSRLIKTHIDVPIEVVPNGYSPVTRPSVPKRNLVLVVARLFPRKGVQHFIESLRGMESDWDFVVAGDGPYMESLQEQARINKSPVRFVGFIDKVTLHRLYQEARILVFPSIRENFPMVLLEGMDAGNAIITTDAEGCAEVVGDAGIVIPAGNAEEIRKALAILMSDSVRRNELSRLARRRVQLFRWARISRLYQGVFAAAVGHDAASALTPSPTPPPIPPPSNLNVPGRPTVRRIS
jgi:glycosyltransferase involved in cell wall biosynthesis